MRKTLVIVAMLALLVIAGCAPKGTPFAADTSTDKDVNSISGEVAEIDVTSTDMDTADLDTLDQELNDIQTMELQ
jgi:protein involved in sex pheromone biosynthesis